MFRSATSFFRPKSVAIVGASDTGGGGWSKGIFDNLAHAGFPADVYLINPRKQSLWGQPVYPNFASLPTTVDLGIFIIPAEATVAAVADGAASGLGTALILAARFGEGGDDVGAARAKALREICDASGLRISGPNCMGSVSLPERLLFYPTPRVRGLTVGQVGVVFQSGGTFQFWLAQGAARGLGYTYAVSSGNELDLDMADYINFLVEDDRTKLIACMAEGVRRPDALMAAAERALEANKPILMLKIGRSAGGQAAAASHTGALASNDSVFDAVCKKFGIIRVDTLDEMIETCLAFSPGRLPAGRRVAMVGYSGGAKGLFIDYADRLGLELAAFSDATRARLKPMIDPGVATENPLDTGAGLAGRLQDFSEICKVVAADPGVDLISVQGQLPISEDAGDDPAVFRRVRDATAKPTLAHNRMSQNVNAAGLKFQTSAGVPFLQRLPELAHAMHGLVTYAERRRKPILTPLPEPSTAPVDLPIEQLLAQRGIPGPRSLTAATAEAAAAAAAKIGFPVALKIISPQALHKTEVDGVALGLTRPESVIEAARAMRTRLLEHAPHATVTGFLVQEMVNGLEVIVGARQDPHFGPFLVLGLGGVLVEALQDVAIRLLPVDRDDIHEMIAELRGKTLLGAFRGAPPRDVNALIEAALTLGDCYLSVRSTLSDIEINPLIVRADGEGVCAVDVRAIPIAESKAKTSSNGH